MRAVEQPLGFLRRQDSEATRRGEYARAVNAQLRKLGHSQLERQLYHLAIEILELLAVFASKFAQHRMIYRSPPKTAT
jgi:hypothetical protein